MRITWAGGAGSTGTIVIMKQGTPVDVGPTDGTVHSFSASFGNAGAHLGNDNYVVHRGAGTQVDVTNLMPETLYYVKVYEYAGSTAGMINYQHDGAPESSETTDASSGEPATQASGVRVSSTTEGVLDVAWYAGSGTGSIVLMKQGVPTDSDPVDGTTYTANPEFLLGQEIGTGNRVVYDGTGVQVTVTGLATDTPYQVAVYTYTGAGASINYKQALPARGIRGHNAAHGIDCVECHFATGAAAHGGFGVPRDGNQDTVCKGCHNQSGPGSAKRDIAIHTGPKYSASVDCGSCHEIHNQYDFTTTDEHPSGATTWNVEWIRSDVTKYRATALEPALFQANTGFFAFDQSNSPWNGICQTCHTGTDWHRNDSSGANDHSHEVLNNCGDCHLHLDGFRGGDCTGCHNQQQEIGTSGTFRRQITESSAGAGDGEFSTSFASHHVNDGTGSQVVTKWDCVVCHAEGDVLTGAPDATYHKNGLVELKDVDTGVALSDDWASVTAITRSDFCLSCHDANGAQIIASRTDPDPEATTDFLNPFNDLVTNAHEPDGLDSSPDTAAPHWRGWCQASPTVRCSNDVECSGADICLPTVVDVASQFDTNNASHHAVLGEAYGGSTGISPPSGDLATAILSPWTWTSTLDCEDCHYGSPLAGHGTSTARYMLRDLNGNEAPTVVTDTTHVCYGCHDPLAQPTVYAPHGRTGDHQQGSRNLYGIGCLNCHGGGVWGGIHGVDEPVTDDDGGSNSISVCLGAGNPYACCTGPGTGTCYTPNVFTYGAALDRIADWTPGVAITCSTVGAPNRLTSCKQHGSRNEPRQYSRPYRAP
jgi:hypothetical protein